MSTSNHGFVRSFLVVAVIGSVCACGDGATTGARTASAAGGSPGAPAGSGGAFPSGSGGAANANVGGGSSGSFISVVDQPDAGAGALLPIAADGATALANMFIMVDKSISMGCSVSNQTCNNMTVGTQPPPTRWSAVTDAIKAFVNSPSSAGAGVGIGFFEGPDFCGVASYAMPTVPIAPLPGVAPDISSALANHSPGGTTPTEPALAGAIQYAKAFTAGAPGHPAVVVLVTDGMPNGCNSTVAGAAAIAQAGYTATPSVKTYVVGLGATAALDQIALAGSGGVDHYFPATGDVSTGLSAALEKIAKAPIR
jgi:hypothetical protein